jgi:hypothetical protein
MADFASGLSAADGGATGVVAGFTVADGGATGVVAGFAVDAGGVTAGSSATASAAPHASHLFCATEHAGHSVNAPLDVATPQLPHLPMLMMCGWPAQFAHIAAYAGTGIRTVADTSSAAIIP